MQIVDCSREDWRKVLRDRGSRPDPEVESIVAGILEDVRLRGDQALLESARRFDSPLLASIEVSEEEIAEARVEDRQMQALQTAFTRVYEFHVAQFDAWTSGFNRGNQRWEIAGSMVGQRVRPLHSAGLYVPGGRASYPSSVLMLAGPAHAAGVKEIAIASPSMPNGSLPPSVLAALRVSRVFRAFKIGGAAAVAAFAFGTESVPKVDKIAGPGNKFVNEAKRQLWGSVGVDGLYGPSEVAVVVDGSANSSFAAADLLTQIEHAPDNLGFLISLGSSPLQDVLAAVNRQISNALRKAILEECLGNAKAFVVSSLEEAAEVVNLIAPEHVTLAVEDPEPLFELVENAGCVLMGEWTPESVADYCLGPCHTLPTGAAARFANPVNVLDFLKIQSFGRLRRDELSDMVPVVESIAEAEGFPAHGLGASVRRL